MLTNDVMNKIKSDIKNNDIVLYMKGTKSIPMCGFSNTVVQMLNALNIEFKDINVLESEELRHGIKEFTNWPTIPQLYVKGEFIGGCDIIREMFEDGELKQLLINQGILQA